jgi:hypothetical protein
VSDVKTIRVELAYGALRVGVRCAGFMRHITIDDAFSRRHQDLGWLPHTEMAAPYDGPAIVSIEINTLEPTDDGDPDELQLCEQAQREERAK